MKNIVIAAGFVCLVGVPKVTFAQNTVTLLDPVNITNSTFPDPGTDMDGATDFASKQLSICSAVTSPPAG